MHSKKTQPKLNDFMKHIYLHIQKNLPILLVIMVAGVIRIAGIYPGFIDYHPDEPASYGTAIYMLYHKFQPDHFFYPAGMPFINAIIYVVTILPVIFIKLTYTHPKFFQDFLKVGSDVFFLYEEYIFGPRGIYALYWTRAITALFGDMRACRAFSAPRPAWGTKASRTRGECSS